MSEEFALCWNNFNDTIATGFQSLLFRGDLCDVTLAVEGKLLKAHKVVLSICSPFFQEMFTTVFHQHPIIVLGNDVRAKLVSNLLEFMYQGSVNVKQSELQAFMRVAETLQIKGLTTSTKELRNSSTDDKPTEAKIAVKRNLERDESSHSLAPKRTSPDEITDLTLEDGIDSQVTEDQFQIIPEVSMVESKFNQTKSREPSETQSGLKIAGSQSLNNFTSFDLHGDASMSDDSQCKYNYTGSESGSNITMLSSTSLLHGNCIFNRNNTVATQAGLKTYWLCKSYRSSMCKARCITHQGKVISATGIHNHLQHMSSKPQEVPPGHTPNVFNPHNSNADFMQNPLSSHHLQHPIAPPVSTQPNYHYLPHQQVSEHISPTPINSRHSTNQPNNAPTNESKLQYRFDTSPTSSGGSHQNFKIEQN